MMKRSSDGDSDEANPSVKSRLDPGTTSASQEDTSLARSPGVATADAASARMPSTRASSDGASSSSDDEAICSSRAMNMKSDKTDPEENDTSPQNDPSLKAPPPSAGSKMDDSQKSPTKLSYPKPKNFAERLMNAVERGIASDSVWWVGGGKAIALNPNNLKTCPELTQYFKAKDYSGFIRNCNRWGFRRVGHYSVEPGVVTYENSLFQQDQPHLVKHMRMDSDVQDVFARHQDGGDEEPRKPEGKSSKGGGRGKKRKSRQETAPPDLTQDESSQPGLIDAFKQSGQLTPDLRAALAALSGGSSGQQPQTTDESTLSKEFLLRKILQLTDQFLDHPGSLYSDNSSFQTTMQLVRALGQQHQQDLVAKGHLGPILRLEAALQPTSPPAPAPAPSPAPASLFASLTTTQGLLGASNPLGNLLGRTSQVSTASATAAGQLQGLILNNSATAQGPQQHLPNLSLQNHAATLLDSVFASQQRPATGQGQLQGQRVPEIQQEQLLSRLISAQKEQVLREQQQQQQETTERHAQERELLERVLAMQRREEQIQEQKADHPGPLVAAAPQGRPPPPQTQQPDADSNRRDSQQFTSAQELMLRVMRQNRQKDR